MDAVSHKWHKSPSRSALRVDEVHIWRAALDRPGTALSRLRETLSADERSRADRFHFEKDRVQFTTAHGILREILSRYRGGSPAEVRFSNGPHGKPGLDTTEGGEQAGATAAGERNDVADSGECVGAAAAEERIEFNMSHSRFMALYAVTLRRAVGVDIEHIREDFECGTIAERFFHGSETAFLRGLPERERREAFFRYWTYKEAYIKARGEGLSIPTKSFAVEIIPGGRAVIRDSGPGSDGSEQWYLFSLDPAPGFAGAVAVEGKDVRLLRYEW